MFNLREAYYSISSGASIGSVVDRWVKGDKARDDDVHATYLPEDVWPYREYAWSREHARRSPEEWDDLVASMQLTGWDPKNPAIVLVGKNGKAKVGEGNHRLAIALQLGVRVPVRFEFRQAV